MTAYEHTAGCEGGICELWRYGLLGIYWEDDLVVVRYFSAACMCYEYTRLWCLCVVVCVCVLVSRVENRRLSVGPLTRGDLIHCRCAEYNARHTEGWAKHI